MERTAQNHPAERRRKGQRPTGPLSFDEPREPLTFDDAADEPAPAPAAAPDAAGDA